MATIESNANARRIYNNKVEESFRALGDVLAKRERSYIILDEGPSMAALDRQTSMLAGMLRGTEMYLWSEWQSKGDAKFEARHLVVVTTMIERRWYDGTAMQLLLQRPREQSLAVMTLLDERLWSRSALRNIVIQPRWIGAPQLSTHEKVSGLNEAERSIAVAGFEDESSYVKNTDSVVPLLWLSQECVRQWGKALAGNDRVRLVCISSSEADGKDQAAVVTKATDTATVSIIDRTMEFRAVSTPEAVRMAQEVAELLPEFNLKELRAFREQRFPNASPLLDIEILCGGLLNVVHRCDDPQATRYAMNVNVARALSSMKTKEPNEKTITLAKKMAAKDSARFGGREISP